MINVELKALLNKCNTATSAALTAAAGLTVNRTHYEVSVEHLMLACLQAPDTDVPIALARFGVDAGRLQAALNDALEDFRAGNASRPVFSPFLGELLEAAWLIASVELSLPRIRTGAILLAFLRKPAAYAQGSYIELLAPINRDDLQKDFWNWAKSSKESDGAAAVESGAAKTTGSGGESFIGKFCLDFTAKANRGEIDAVFGRDQEIRQIVDILGRRRKNNPILVGEPGVGKTAVIEGLALRVVQGDVPDALRDVTLLALDMGLLEAGAGMKGEFERRLKGVLDEIKSSEKPIILFIDEAHTLVGAGNSAGGSDAANLLKPSLARGEIKTCAATTWVEYKKYFEKDPALARRFQLVSLDEPNVTSATLILRGLREAYEKAHAVIIRDDALASAAELADRFIQGRFLPDKAIDLLDTACARVKVNLSSKPASLEDIERSIQAMERERRALSRDAIDGEAIASERIEALAKQIADATERAEELRIAWRKELDAADRLIAARDALNAAREAADTDEAEAPDAAGLTEAFNQAKTAFLEARSGEGLIETEVTPDIIARVVSDWTGIPVGKMAREQAALVASLDEKLRDRIKGQDSAIELISAAIKASRAGLRPIDQPQGVFLLAGPSGVGKTETGLALADLLFGDEKNAVTINMSEFQEKHTVSRLIGSPPGYVGYGEGGMLTEAVRQRPYSVVLLDETEKAHIDVLNLFYQVFDKGILTDGEGKNISFRNTIIILTSNLAADVIQEMTKEGADIDPDVLMNTIRPILSEHFKPALLARMTIVPYRALSDEAMKRVTKLKLDALAGHLERNTKMALSYSAQVIDQIASRCTEVETGARNIEYVISGTIMPQLSQAVLSQMTGHAMPASVALDVGEDGGFITEFA